MPSIAIIELFTVHLPLYELIMHLGLPVWLINDIFKSGLPPQHGQEQNPFTNFLGFDFGLLFHLFITLNIISYLKSLV